MTRHSPPVLGRSLLPAERPGLIGFLFLPLLQNAWKGRKFSSQWKDVSKRRNAAWAAWAQWLLWCILYTGSSSCCRCSKAFPWCSFPQILCAVTPLLLEITAVKFSKWRVCCPTSGCSGRGDSSVTHRGRALALHPDNALWRSEENRIWLMHLQCKKMDSYCPVFLCLWLCNVDWSQCSELSRFSPCKQ